MAAAGLGRRHPAQDGVACRARAGHPLSTDVQPKTRYLHQVHQAKITGAALP